MSTQATKRDPLIVGTPPAVRAKSVRFSTDTLYILLRDGVEISAPLTRYPRLLNAAPAQRNNWLIEGYGIHWPDIDEDISPSGLLGLPD